MIKTYTKATVRGVHFQWKRRLHTRMKKKEEKKKDRAEENLVVLSVKRREEEEVSDGDAGAHRENRTSSL